MKLKTTMQDGCVHVNGCCVDFTDLSGGVIDKLEHDAAAAHALMQAQDEFWKQDDLDSLDARDAVEMIGVRADEILAEWGFDSGEVE